ncbi:MAG: class I SAM-dependent rRNA methyltransferase [Candidatus Sericytochromatia bacterium]|nr:class I SAM-dependent rRNA methyltransferase [Candidatus Tanganyikabacteria bacterium]
MASVTLRRGREARLRGGHPWIFAGDLAALPPSENAGEAVEVLDHRGRFLAMALCNPRSNLTLRVVSRQREEIGRLFVQQRLAAALQLRRHLLGDAGAARLVNAESDGLPAFVVDRYGDFLVVQSLALAADRLLPHLVEELVAQTGPQGVYERSDAPVRALEGLPERTGVLWGAEPPPLVEIREGEARFLVDVREGQKTGFFLDQRPNRLKLGALCKGKRVLNTFCYSGGFSIPAALGGAAEVIGVDTSGAALELAEKNAEANEVGDRCSWVEANAFDHLRDLDRLKERFDVVVLDPPAFTKTKDSIPGAVRGYKEINLRALKILAPGGLLVSASCSHHIDPQLFLDIVADAAADAGRTVRMIDYAGPGPDHPSLPAAPETRYLKCFWGVVT